jgi:16S rRNA (adenine1518-N6/adenine1519-N6)-dimethyltransferase
MAQFAPAKKSLGQNFLVDQNALTKIAELVPGDTELLLEIGPGRGALTELLAQRCEHICLLEKDEALLASTRTQLLLQKREAKATWAEDALDFDYSKIWTDTGLSTSTPLGVAANLPYNVATEILFRLLELRERIPWMVLMFQKEVAKRIAAKPGNRDYGTISVLVQNYYEASEALRLKPESFRPRPKVESSVVYFERLDKPQLEFTPYEWERFRSFIREAFRYRRKTLGNSLNMGKFGPSIRRGFASPAPRVALERANIDAQLRAETLSLQDFGRLFRELCG